MQHNRINPVIVTITSVLLLIMGIQSPIVGLIGLVIMWKYTNWPKWVKILVTIPELLLFISAILAFVYMYVLRPFQVNGNAMDPTYKDGMYLATNIVPQNTNAIQRNDVIIFVSLTNPQVKLIKRVIGLPGETVMIKSGDLYINGQKIDESAYLPPGVQTNGENFLTEGKSEIIPPGQYFVLGDNRSHSMDSREWGFIPAQNIISKVSFCYWNCTKN